MCNGNGVRVLCGLKKLSRIDISSTSPREAMRYNRRSPIAAGIITCALLLSLSTGVANRNAEAHSDNSPKAQTPNGARGKKVSSDLSELVRGAASGDESVQVILQTRGEAGEKLNALLR